MATPSPSPSIYFKLSLCDELFIHRQGTLIVCRSGANNKIWRQTDNTHRAIDFVTRAVAYITKGIFEVFARVLVFSARLEVVDNGSKCAFKKKTKRNIHCLLDMPGGDCWALSNSKLFIRFISASTENIFGLNFWDLKFEIPGPDVPHLNIFLRLMKQQCLYYLRIRSG